MHINNQKFIIINLCIEYKPKQKLQLSIFLFLLLNLILDKYIINFQKKYSQKNLKKNFDNLYKNFIKY